MSATLPAERGTHSAGFGIVEVIVSMFLLSLMAMAFLPVIVQSQQLARTNALIATATQLLSADLDRARQSTVTCDPPPSIDPRVEDEFTVTGVWAGADGCGAGGPTTLSYTSKVKITGADKVLAQAVTLILVNE